MIQRPQAPEDIKHDLQIFRKFRKTDGVSLAGAIQLVHPDIVEIVRLIAQQGLKPIINTNGLALSKELLRELKRQGSWDLLSMSIANNIAPAG